MTHGVSDESHILAEIRLALGLDSRVVLFRNNVGVAERGGVRRLRFGIGGTGGADLVGIMAPLGRFVALEVKAQAGRPGKNQETFLALIRSMGGFACIVRSVAEARAAIERASLGAAE